MIEQDKIKTVEEIISLENNFTFEITKLTKKLYLEDEKTYTIKLVAALASELLRGYKATKIYKPNTTGTKVSFTKLDDKLFDFEIKKIRDKLNKFLN